jgi:hypothetical protein
MKTPRERWKASVHARPWLEMHDAPVIQAALDTALLQLDTNLATSSDAQTAAANRWRMEGARAFASILLGLSDPEIKPTRVPTDNLREPNV